ncbi:Glycosyl transferase family 14 protein [Dioscorea alata]|uniref:Glycosyl transferase family 14 protein n=1 Tax=Dioscorea alata TaxID=55571 RepID=A0ACB7WEW2_DIOAL|nr:Glycosyl transferase family 14 protein [Dioscorea alata]
MEPLKSRAPQVPLMEKRWAFPMVLCWILCAILLLSTFNKPITSNTITTLFSSPPPPLILSNLSSPPPSPSIPRFAYLISGSKGDLEKLWRTLHAVYHPRNVYVLHLDLKAPAMERKELEEKVEMNQVFKMVMNVHVIRKANMVTYKGPTMVANTLHACAVLLKKSKDWDWFINLSASDYPLVTQDDLLHTFSSLPRNLSFLEYFSNLGWKEDQRAKPLIIDPGLYKTNKSDVFWASQRRELPTAFKLFTGSAWMVLSREFVEYTIWGWDNLPRTLLMYYTNFVSSSEGYFQTLICNTPEFMHTVVNHDLHYISWDRPPKQHPRTLSVADAVHMIDANVPFARKFNSNAAVLDKIDGELLGGRRNESFVYGGWCEGSPACTEVGDVLLLKPGIGAQRLGKLMDHLLGGNSGFVTGNQCK